jgi:hypothetical protein
MDFIANSNYCHCQFSKGYLAQRFKTPPWLSNLQIAFANHLSLLFQYTTSNRAKMCKSLVIATIRQHPILTFQTMKIGIYLERLSLVDNKCWGLKFKGRSDDDSHLQDYNTKICF